MRWLVAAGAATVAINLVALSTVFAAVSYRKLRRLRTDHIVPSVFVDLVLAATGMLVALLVILAPAALPLLLAPLLLYRGRARARSEEVQHLEAERDRFERTVVGAHDGVVLLAHDGRVEVWNPAIQVMTGRAARPALTYFRTRRSEPLADRFPRSEAVFVKCTLAVTS